MFFFPFGLWLVFFSEVRGRGGEGQSPVLSGLYAFLDQKLFHKEKNQGYNELSSQVNVIHWQVAAVPRIYLTKYSFITFIDSYSVVPDIKHAYQSTLYIHIYINPLTTIPNLVKYLAIYSTGFSVMYIKKHLCNVITFFKLHANSKCYCTLTILLTQSLILF